MDRQFQRVARSSRGPRPAPAGLRGGGRWAVHRGVRRPGRGRARRRARRLGAAVLVVVLAAIPAEAAQPLTVAAASSLTDVLAELATRFEAASAAGGSAATGARDPAALRIAFGASSTLATQILQGAPFDVFASADAAQMERVAAAGLVRGDAPVFAHNRLVLAVGAGTALRSLADLAEAGIVLVLAAPQVPAGAYADEALRRAAVDLGEAWQRAVEANVVSREPNVRQVAAKVALGEADAALVYATDVRNLAGVISVALPAGVSPVARYPVAVLEGAADPSRAGAFVDFLFGPEAQAILRDAGFGLPED